jgi:hypothetical protein
MRTAERLEDPWPGIRPDGPPDATLDLPGQQKPVHMSTKIISNV